MISLVEILLLSHDPISASGNHGKIIESPLVTMIWILSSDFKLMMYSDILDVPECDPIQ